LPISKLSIHKRRSRLPSGVAKQQHHGVKRKSRGPSPLAATWIRESVSTIPGRLETALKTHGWTAKELAKRSGVSEAVISRTAQGMNLWSAIALARALHVRVGWLVAGEEPSGLDEIRKSKAPPPAATVVDIEDDVPAGKEERKQRRPTRARQGNGPGRSGDKP
jgi:transcriptional regulator with XRE-family HTH domain